MGRLGGSRGRRVFGTAQTGYIAINFCNIFDTGGVTLVNNIFFNFRSEYVEGAASVGCRVAGSAAVDTIQLVFI